MISITSRVIVELLVNFGINDALYSFQIFLIRGESTFVFCGESVQTDILAAACTGSIIEGIHYATVSGDTSPDGFLCFCHISINGQTIFKEFLAVFQYIFGYFSEIDIKVTSAGGRSRIFNKRTIFCIDERIE